MSDFSERLAAVRSRLEAATRRSGRAPQDVTLVAVTKTVETERIREAMHAGQRVFGENRVQEARRKMAEFPGAVWHLVGHLQRNKAREAARFFQVIHSVDSVSLMRDVARHAVGREKPIEILIQVNLAREETKHGAQEGELPEILAAAGDLASMTVVGLMILPPHDPDPERSRPYFRRLAELAAKMDGGRFANVSMRELSMGMSEDFEVAAEEGATLVRIGRALFGERPPRPA